MDTRKKIYNQNENVVLTRFRVVIKSLTLFILFAIAIIQPLYAQYSGYSSDHHAGEWLLYKQIDELVASQYRAGQYEPILCPSRQQSFLPIGKTSAWLLAKDWDTTIVKEKPTHKLQVLLTAHNIPLEGELIETLPESIVILNKMTTSESYIQLSYDTISMMNIDMINLKKKNAFLTGGVVGGISMATLFTLGSIMSSANDWFGAGFLLVIVPLYGAGGFLLGGLIGEVASVNRFRINGDKARFAKAYPRLDKRSMVKHLK